MEELIDRISHFLMFLGDRNPPPFYTRAEIEKIKERQLKEIEFEEKLNKECWRLNREIHEKYKMGEISVEEELRLIERIPEMAKKSLNYAQEG